jgi:hypothetical protein
MFGVRPLMLMVCRTALDSRFRVDMDGVAVPCYLDERQHFCLRECFGQCVCNPALEIPLAGVHWGMEFS